MDKPMSVDELADFLGVPSETVRYWRRSEAGPRSYKVGRHVRFDPVDVRAWLDKRKQACAS